MKPGLQLVLFDAAADPARTLHQRLCQRGLAPARRDLREAVDDVRGGLPDIAVLILGADSDQGTVERMACLLERLVSAKVATLVWGSSDNLHWTGGPLVEWLAPDVSLDEVLGRLSTLARYVPLIRRFDRELEHLHRLGEQLNRYFSEIDQEMRLAGRLQRDFLPRKLPELPELRFSLLYRPASWVSGDIYDASRIDEQHVGLFVADAMGHGVAAALLTMSLRQALVAKRIDGSSYTLINPAQVLADLHTSLVRQKLPNCQFVSAVYAHYNRERRELRLARGGHPYPLHIRPGGEIEPIVVGGGLLGLQDVPSEFDEVRVTLQRGDKVIFFTDGLEDEFFVQRGSHTQSDEFTPALREWAALDVRAFAEALEEHLDGKQGSLHPVDDITMLALEVVD